MAVRTGSSPVPSVERPSGSVGHDDDTGRLTESERGRLRASAGHDRGGPNSHSLGQMHGADRHRP